MKQFYCSLVLLVALTSLSNDALAQITTMPASGATIRNARFIPSGIIGHLNTPLEMEVKGTPYFSEDFAKSKLFLTTGNFEDVPMRYNIYNDQMEFIERDSVFVIEPDPIVSKVMIGETTFVLDYLEIDSKPVLCYFQLQHSGAAALLTKMVVIFREAEVGKAMQGNLPPTYSRINDIHFLKIGSDPLIKITNIKKLIEALPKHKPEMEAFAKKEKIQAGKVKELTKFLAYYNSL